MLALNPYITFKGNCRQAIEFYQTALGAEVLFTQTVGDSPMPNMGPAENIMHCTIQIGESKVMLSDDPRPESPAGGGNISLAIGLNDPKQAEHLFAQLENEGSVIMQLQKTYWAEAFGMVIDKFGVKWMVNCESPR